MTVNCRTRNYTGHILFKLLGKRDKIIVKIESINRKIVTK